MSRRRVSAGADTHERRSRDQEKEKENKEGRGPKKARSIRDKIRSDQILGRGRTDEGT
jgi:hypothetical protein